MIFALFLCAFLAVQANRDGASGEYMKRFMTQYNKIHDPTNGYFGTGGSPYHSRETVIVEAPDYGHESVSETYSYYIALEVAHGFASGGSWSGLTAAWPARLNYIPTSLDDPNRAWGAYNPQKPAEFEPEEDEPSQYPVKPDTSFTVGQDPLFDELNSTYPEQHGAVYGMHWLIDVEDWYGYGRHGQGGMKNSFINSYQRGPMESVFKTVVFPDWADFEWGTGTAGGFLPIFSEPPAGSSFQQQFRYTTAPDATARLIQHMYWAEQFCKKVGGCDDIKALMQETVKISDYMRYAMFDKYFVQIGSSKNGPGSHIPGTGRDSAHYLMSWYWAFGGSQHDKYPWAWIIGCSHTHFGYQNPFAAWTLSKTNPEESMFAAVKQRAATATQDWSASLKQQLAYYKWLQSAEGAIGGGATNSNHGRYLAYPSGAATFKGLLYQQAPVYEDPPSNQWFGWQTWSMGRVMQYLYESKDDTIRPVADKWISWAMSHVTCNSTGFSIPSTENWSGQPEIWPEGMEFHEYQGSPNLHVKIVGYTDDVGTGSSLTRTLTWYAAATNNQKVMDMAKCLLDTMHTHYEDDLGITNNEPKPSYCGNQWGKGLLQTVYIPPGLTVKTPQNPTGIQSTNSTFMSQRPSYFNDGSFTQKFGTSIKDIEASCAKNPAPVFKYHRTWAQVEYALANFDYGRLNGGGPSPPAPGPTPGPAPGPAPGPPPSNFCNGKAAGQYCLPGSDASAYEICPAGIKGNCPNSEICHQASSTTISCLK